MKRREFLMLTAALPIAIRSLASNSSAGAVEFLDAIVKDGTVPGAALMASQNSVTRLEHAVGTCCKLKERQAPVTLNTIHPLYSFSKLITGTVVALIKQEGKLDYDDPVTKHIPEFTGGGKESITLRHCLTHSAGLAKVQSQPVYDEAGWNAALATLCAASTEWPPGSMTSYHGWSGAFLAAECARRVSAGAAWAELCRERLFAPLGAKSLSFSLPADDADISVVPQPEASKPLPRTAKEAFPYAGQPGAGCTGTLADALKVLHLHVQQGLWNSRTLIAKDVFREIHTVQFEKEIQAARAAGSKPKHESWGLGLLLRGAGPANGSHKWFGFHNQPSPGVFGHAGIDTLIGIGNPATGVAFVFVTTNSPKPSEKTTVIRNQVTDLLFSEIT
jgi:CubicO group peptidase (beta-lactamase class C family)